MKQLFIILLLYPVFVGGQSIKRYKISNIDTIKTDSYTVIRFSIEEDTMRSDREIDLSGPSFILSSDTCVKDTSLAYITAARCDSCNVRLMTGYVVSDKCQAGPGQYTYENEVLLDKRKQPIPATVRVIRYARKNDNE